MMIRLMFLSLSVARGFSWNVEGVGLIQASVALRSSNVTSRPSSQYQALANDVALYRNYNEEETEEVDEEELLDESQDKSSSHSMSYKHFSGNHKPSRAVIMEGCSGSSFMLALSGRMLRAHGVPIHSVGEGGSHRDSLLKKTARYASATEKELMNASSTPVALRIAIDAAKRHGQELFFKTNPKIKGWEPSFQEMSSFLKDNVMSVLVLRRNLLDWNICRVRDCFDGGAQGHPVTPDGKEDKACISRRKSSNITTMALVKSHKMVKKVEKDVIFRTEMVWKLIEEGVVKEPFYIEDLLSFERASADFDTCIGVWADVMRSWGVKPDLQKIRRVLKKTPTAGKLPDPASHSQVVYNIVHLSNALATITLKPIYVPEQPLDTAA
eukprot:CAMPEP_0170598256 /NCGR_PEP_ID=MMETSP0224-20130122/16147_1 /TAXON_ID=285029 /ORGANISM="Togula jolla, Strain CCCM 725" /LENGTH=382 /DNA_ID=CAMNT_0010922789 /DNA_START=70 /DNA_END=1216 /DNA_ORIENTATION=+